MKLKLLLASFMLLTMNVFSQFSYINVGGTNREMIVHVPANLGTNRPMVISLHGLNQDAPFQQSSANWEQVADTAKFVVVYPNAINKSWDISGTRDINFLEAIIDQMHTQHQIDLNRVYVTGFSMGGMMSYHTANNIADKIAAIGPVSGYLFANPVSSSRPMPIIHTHGTSDDVVGYNGVAGVLSKWRNWNGCPSGSTLIDPYPANRPSSGGSYEQWNPCDENSEVVLITLEGKGHWHSNDENNVHTTREIWKFFMRHSLGSSTDPTVTITSPTNNQNFITPASVTINATASDPNGTISKVEFFNGNTKLGEDATAPYSYNWNNVSLGTYTIRTVATDNEGNTAEHTVTIRVNIPQAPYEGNVHLIPGTIQLEEYDVGGNGNAYYDDTEGSETGVAFRNDEDVDLENCIDTGGGYNIGWSTAGEWLEYTVDVQAAGLYELEIRAACNGADRTLSVDMDGEAIATDVAIPNTAGWQAWQTVTVENIMLMPGEKVMRLTIGETDFINLNYVTFNLVEEFVQEPYNGTPHPIPGRIEAEEYDLGREGLGYHEANANGNQGNADFRGDEVDIETTGDIDGEYNIAYTLTGEWLAYTVNVAQTGLYDIDLRVGRDGDNGSLHIEMDGNNVTGAIAVPNTGAWQTYQTVTVEDVSLTAGEQEMRIYFDTDYMNLNYVVFTAVIQDADNDGTPDNEDACPNDPNKATSEGDCGCGEVETDTDADGIADCIDEYPNDADNDGTTTAEDCDDHNPDVSLASTWFADTDADGVGVATSTITACSQPDGYVAISGDECPEDINKTLPGECGCGATEESCLDCAGTPNGDAFYDNCNNCVASEEEACTQDCSGEWGGTAAADACGTCAGGSTGIMPVTNPDECIATSVDEVLNKEDLVYPNPTKGEVFLYEIKEWTLMDLSGNPVMSGYSNKIELYNLLPGMYFLNFDDKVIKLVKE